MHGHNHRIVHVAIDAKNSFNNVERQLMLHAVQTQAPSLARWTHYIYGTSDPVLVAKGGTIPSSQGTQQGDPTSMLLFSLTIHPLVQKVARECDLMLNAWYADDAHLIGRITEISRALRITRNHGPQVNYIMQPHKSEIY